MNINRTTIVNGMIMRLTVVLMLTFSMAAHAGDPTKGKALYGVQCASCHGKDGAGALKGAPDFSMGESLSATDADLLGSIQAGKGIMPAYKGRLTAEQILDIIAYIRTFNRS